MRFFLRPVRLLVVSLLLMSAGACLRESQKRAQFRFEVRGGLNQTWSVVAVTKDSEVIDACRAQLERSADQRELFIAGPIARGSGGHNRPWSWHFVPDKWALVETSIELCDGTPDMVEKDLDYWIGTVKSYCPWGSKIVEEMG